MALVVVPDGASVPRAEQFHVWSRTLAGRGFTSIRTGALAERQAVHAERAGLACVQELALLQLTTPRARARPHHRVRRLRHAQLGAAAGTDRAAFGDEWWLDESMLVDVGHATPVHRSRRVQLRPGRDVDAFLISGRAGRVGYIQRLAVRPEAQRHGLATDLMLDALGWMHRLHVTRAFVNTHVGNEAALRLYRGLGFVELAERLRVYEGPIPL
jgi:ribosomal protein S18 acetylase RimI-like enzyme